MQTQKGGGDKRLQQLLTTATAMALAGRIGRAPCTRTGDPAPRQPFAALLRAAYGKSTTRAWSGVPACCLFEFRTQASERWGCDVWSRPVSSGSLPMEHRAKNVALSMWIENPALQDDSGRERYCFAQQNLLAAEVICVAHPPPFRHCASADSTATSVVRRHIGIDDGRILVQACNDSTSNRRQEADRRGRMQTIATASGGRPAVAGGRAQLSAVCQQRLAADSGSPRACSVRTLRSDMSGATGRQRRHRRGSIPYAQQRRLIVHYRVELPRRISPSCCAMQVSTPAHQQDKQMQHVATWTASNHRVASRHAPPSTL